MNIETIDDILNELADKLYVYGCCKAAANGKDECNEKDSCCCRESRITIMNSVIHPNE